MPQTPTLALVRDLGETLEAAGVGYCHFKSNAYLARTRSGENDLDLLVARRDATRFVAALHGLGFKQALDGGRSLPGVLHYYGRDPQAERLVHVHAHHQLIVGDDLTKSYRLPLERAFIETASPQEGLRVPAPELELILLVVRLTLKHGSWDAMATRRDRMPASARVELAYLEERVSEAAVRAALEQHLPFVGAATFDRSRRALAPNAGRLERVRAADALIGELAPCARRSRAEDVSLKGWRWGAGIAMHIAGRRPPKKRLAAGGAVIAIVGADGAGKSTTIDALEAWLGRTFQVTRVHLGRPPRSAVTRALRAAGLARSAAALALSRGRPRVRGSERAGQRAVLAVGLARDRRLLARRSRARAVNGALVLSDRWPVPQLESMDAPRVRRLLGPRSAGVIGRALGAAEDRSYTAIPPPDILIVLRVDPEVAVARKPEEPAEFVRSRWDEIWAINWEAAGAHVVDAGRPLDEVLEEIKAIIWSEV